MGDLFPADVPLAEIGQGHPHLRAVQIDEGTPTHAAREGTPYWDKTNNKFYVNSDGGTTWTEMAAGGGSGHNILDASRHTDSVADAVTRGSLIYGNATPKWDELVIGAAARLFQSDGAQPSWVAMSGDAAIAAGGAVTVAGTHAGTAHHVKYTDSEAIAAVEGEATLTLAGDVTIANFKGLVVGHTAYITTAAGVRPAFQVLGSGQPDSATLLAAFRANSLPPSMHFLKSRSATIGGHAIVQDNDVLLRMRFFADDGADFATETARFFVEVDDASPAVGDIGVAYVWWQMPGGGGSLAETMRISAAGQLLIPVTGSGSGLLLGGDAQLYRSAADELRTPDTFVVDIALKSDTINERTADAGVTVDGVLLKDSGIPEAAVTVHEAAITHDNLSGGTAATAHHTKYTDADAISAVPFVSYISLGSAENGSAVTP